MTPQRWQEVKAALHEAMQLAPGARLAYLDEISTDDPELRLELEALLAANDELSEGFLSEPAVLAAIADGELPDPLIGTRVGPYQIVEEIGTGGMGKVYRAVRRDDEFDQVVAIKLVRAEQGSSFVLHRLRSERQILAGLDHPNITRLLDGGTTSTGLPYLVMEFVDGEPIEQYCAARQLDVTAKLELFVQVCSAVHYAHQRLIIHRDIKPGNILITPQGVPKLLDFGIAKILAADGTVGRDAATVSVVRLFTPGYASPEQVKGGVITTATDVYSLGVVLYQLLTGLAPSAIFASPGTVAKPSTLVRRGGGTQRRGDSLPAMRATLARRLAGDLDNIVLRAMHADPERRYSSAEQLASDIRAHLSQRPVIARPDTVGYRVSRFVARHTGAVAVVAALSLALIGAAGVIWNEARVAQAERARAERRFNDVRRLASSLLREIYPSVNDLPGSTPARQLIVNRALEYLDSLSRDAGGDIPLERELAGAYSLVGDVQGNGYYANLGHPSAALASYRKGLLIWQRIAAATPGDKVAAVQLAAAYREVGTALETLRDFDGALASYRAAAQLSERLIGLGAGSSQLDFLAGTHYYLAEAAVGAGRLDEAEASIRRAMAVRSAIVAADPLVRLDVATHSAGDHSVAAEVLEHRGRFGEALDEERRSIDIVTKLARENPNNQTLQTFVGQSILLLAQIEEQAGRYADALASYRLSVPSVEEVLRTDPNDALARYDVAEGYERIGALEVREGRVAPGLEDLNRAREALSPLGPRDGDYPDFRALFADCYADLGQAHEALAGHRPGELRAAHEWYRQSLEKWRDLKQRGLLTVWEQARPAEVARMLAANEAALAGIAAAQR